jgi:hypothetical protein
MLTGCQTVVQVDSNSSWAVVSWLVFPFNFFFKLTFSRACAPPRAPRGEGGGARARQENRQFLKKIDRTSRNDPPPPLGGLARVRARLEIVNFEKKLKTKTN